MSELRLVPAAVVVWAVTLLLMLGIPLAALLVLVVPAGLLLMGQPGQALFTGVLGGLAAGATAWRQHLAAAWSAPEELAGRVVGLGSGLVRIRAPDHPALLTVFTQDPVEPGSLVSVDAAWSPSRRPGLADVVGNGELTVLAGPTGMPRVAATVRAALGDAVDATVGESSRGLVPGMVLGDVSAQSGTERQLYIDTGLSHLSAVSGQRRHRHHRRRAGLPLFTLGPRVQVGAAVFWRYSSVWHRNRRLRASSPGSSGCRALGSTA